MIQQPLQAFFMSDPLIGKTLKDAYLIESALADGGMGVVYLAEQMSLGRKVVLKVLRPNFDDEDFIELFLREARINSQLNHPNVVSVFDFGKTDEGITFLAMEYLNGHTLNDIVAASKGLSLAKTMWVMEQICSAVHAAHKLDIVHRDLKPNNVMVSSLSGDGMVAKILDFGISKPLAEQDLKYTQMGMVMGTPAYLAPEQIMGQRNIDIRADIYALGAILYYVVSGTAPYKGASSEIIMNRQLTSEPLALEDSQLHDAQTMCLVPVITRAMALEREGRYPDVGSFWNDILEHASDYKHTTLPNEEKALEATRYQLVFKGDIDSSSDKETLRPKLQKALKFNDKQAEALFSGRRIIIRKNLTKESAEKMREQLLRVGALGEIEEMHDATRIISRDERASLSHSLPNSLSNSLPSVGMVEAISLSDIRAASKIVHQEKSRAYGNQVPVEHGSENKSAKKSKFSRTASLVFIPCLALLVMVFSIYLYPPFRYQISDMFWYSVRGNEIPRGVSRNTIKIGISAAFSGSAREIGQSMRVGINAYFLSINNAGGVHGRQLKLVELDDGYEPEQALKNVESFLDPSAGVFSLLGNVGTPTAKAILPKILEAKMLQFGTFSGSPILRNNPPDRYIFNYRASYAEETYALIQYFVSELELEPKKIGVFYQNDSYGLAGLIGVEEALHGYNVSHNEIIKANYVRNTSQVERAVSYFLGHTEPLEAIVMVSTYAASAAFIHQMRKSGYSGVFANVSFVGSLALVERLDEIGQPGEGVIVSQVVPPYSSYATGVLKYREDLEKYFPGEAPNFVSLEGYIIASIFIEALNRSGRHFNTERVIDALETVNGYDLGIGTKINFSLSDHQGSHRVWGTVIDSNNEYQSIKLVDE